MMEDEVQNLLKLTSEDFYRNVEEQYGKNVVKVLKHHDIDSYFILGETDEDSLFSVFENPNDENSSDELISLKKDICNFIGEKVSLKIGTKGKLIILLNEARAIIQKKKQQLLAEKRFNRHNKSRSQSSSTCSSATAEINLKECYTSIERSIIKLLTNINNNVHGVIMTNVSSNDFKIDVKCVNDDAEPTCLIQCICGDRVRLYFRQNGFQISNLSKHLKSIYNKSKIVEINEDQNKNDSESSNDMIIDDESSVIDKQNNKYSTINSDTDIASTSITNRKTLHQQQKSQFDSSNDNNNDSSAEKTNIDNERQSFRISTTTSEDESSISINNKSQPKHDTTVDERLRTSDLPIHIRSIKDFRKQKDHESDLSDRKKSKLDINKKQFTNNSSAKINKKIRKVQVYNKASDADFLFAVLETIDSNSHRPSNNYRYPQCVFRFATIIAIIAGRYVYEFLRMNLRFLLPTIQTIENNWSYQPYKEANFRFEETQTYLSSNKCQYIFVSEDCSAIIPRIEYDASLDVFNGFVTPVLEGLPTENTFRCTTIQQLKNLFETNPYANLVNIHVVQPIVDSNNALVLPTTVLAAYGTDHKLTAIDILKRWLIIYKKFYSRGIRVLGFSTDGDPKYLRAMRLAANFFVRTQILNIYNNTLAFKVKIPLNWMSWFFLSSTQLFLFVQDGVHLCTKIRNRMLSKSAELTMGSYEISMEHLHDLIRSTNKLDHNLSISDLNVKDKQNFVSCQKISDDKVLNLLLLNDKYRGTYNYLLILNLLITAYTERAIALSDRIYYASIVLFYVRLWRICLHIERPPRKSTLSEKNKNKKKYQSPHFITSNALLCIELNAHYLIYVYLLVEQNVLPQSIAESIYLFSSQPCENIFRNARALSGVYSTRINFTIMQFLKRLNKLNALTELKHFEETNTEQKIVFPVHHKIRRFMDKKESNNNTGLTSFNTHDLEKIILHAYEVAQEMINFVDLSNSLIKNNMFNIEQSSKIAKQLLQLNCLTESKVVDVDGSTDEEETSDDEDLDTYNNELADIMYDGDFSEDESITTNSFENLQGTTYSGMRLKKSVSSSNVHKYFPVNIHGETFYLHKQTATWYLQEKQQRVPCDRLQRVQTKAVE
ncbi:unnamed protein product [Rotaria sp. Silwood1]|nr:unnamed protein product [Rotaria sp. Silwood1]CAF1609076.1 unnamed protein product [Rotaria sp. Silwood1]CAF3711885.1 unnamed protein product [Rotaria sp. Silwood1]CAF3824776.1 unnamed protein product [Rotaria sp. Silwood1]CAF4906687.1 unnamed protein product [Rotaria sp. Silwood1]